MLTFCVIVQDLTKISSFERLPSELREMIYDYCRYLPANGTSAEAAEVVYPWDEVDSWDEDSRDEREARTLDANTKHSGVLTHLFGINKLIHTEASIHFFKNNEIVFWDLDRLLDLSVSHFGPALRNAQRLEIWFAGEKRLEALEFIKTELKLLSLTIIFDSRSWARLIPRASMLEDYLGSNRAIITDTLGFDELLSLPQVKDVHVGFAHSVRQELTEGYMDGIEHLIFQHLVPKPDDSSGEASD